MQGAGNPQQRGEVSPWNEDESTFCSKPFILLAKLSHTRFKPVFYRWVFPHFLIGAPVRQEGLNKDLISLDDQPFWRRNWFRVEAQDHLARSVSNITLSAKLDKFLLEKGVDPKLFPHCYLITPPRFLELPLFNAVSVWYLYFNNHELGALIVEVHNSAHERCNYFLHSGLSYDVTQHDSILPAGERTDAARSVNISCDKEFHASAFSPRDGASYTTRAIDPLHLEGDARGSVNVTITISSDIGPTRLVARLWSNCNPIDPSKISFIDKARLLLMCLWIELLAFPRAVCQMMWMHFVKRMELFTHPEPKRGSVSRPSTKNEVFLEDVFRGFLGATTESFHEPVILHYVAAEETKTNPTCREAFTSGFSAEASPKEAELSILSPSFYSSLVQYHSIPDALQGEFFNKKDSRRTIYIRNHKLLMQMFHESKQTNPRQSLRHSSMAQYLCIRLRRGRARNNNKTSYQRDESSGLTQLDRYVIARQRPEYADEYFRRAFRILFLRRYRLIHHIWIAALALIVGFLMTSLNAWSDGNTTYQQIGLFLISVSTLYWCIFVSKEDTASFLLI